MSTGRTLAAWEDRSSYTLEPNLCFTRAGLDLLFAYVNTSRVAVIIGLSIP
jgi:delta-aminolevulinic acid dehydratase/porphobilinogen synthase